MGGFEKLERIVTLTVTYRARGNISINTGRGDGIRDNLVIREGGPGSDPVISGSSVKGVVRSIIEAMLTQASEAAATEEEKARLKVCVPPTCRGTRYKVDKNGEIIRNNKGEPQKQPDVPGNRLKPEACEDNTLTPGRKPCLVCQMFGNTKSKGKVAFHDAKPSVPITTISRIHVAIARSSGTAGEGALMTMETVPSRASFVGSVVLVNPCKWMVGAAIDVLNLLPKLGVGAKTTSGYGELEVCVEPEFTLRPVNETEAMEDYKRECIRIWREMAKHQYA